MAKKLYVGGLPYSITEDDLRELFAQAGTVATVAIIMDRDSGRSKGFGFVEMSTEEEAQKAIQMFNEYVLEERTLVVNEARPMEKREGGNRGGGGGYNRGGNSGGYNRGGNGGGRRSSY